MSSNVCCEGYSRPWVCTQCGVCAAMCPQNALTMKPSGLGYRYPELEAERCTSCGICTAVCPGPRLTADADRSRPTDSDQIYGPIESLGLGWAADGELRRSASSGGLVTALLMSMLKAGTVRGAVVTDLGAEGCMPRTRLARTPEEILEARGSKYMITSLDDAIREMIGGEQGPFAVVGMPCQIRGLRGAMQHSNELGSSISLRVSLFCGGTKDYRYRSLLVNKMGLDGSDLVQFAFRGGGWPGEMSGQDGAGRVGTLTGYDRQLGRIWAGARLTPPRCLLCDDPLGAAADIAVGDPWRIDDDRDGPGRSLFLARTRVGARAIDRAHESGAIGVDESIAQSDVIRSAEGILWRRYYAPSRVGLAALWARAWRRISRETSKPSLGLMARAARAFALSRLGGGGRQP